MSCGKCSCVVRKKTYSRSFTEDNKSHVVVNGLMERELRDMFECTRPVVRLATKDILLDYIAKPVTCGAHGGAGVLVKVWHKELDGTPHGCKQFSLCLGCLIDREANEHFVRRFGWARG